jgi:DNA-binding NarL/FixJ family response regulator
VWFALRALIVEDEWLIAMDLAETLRQAGHEVVGLAVDAEEAIAIARECKPDLALMDLRLSNGTSGIDAAARLWREAGVRCIFVSANLDGDTVDSLRPLEPLGFVAKPILPARLRHAMGVAEIALAAAS